MVLFDEIEKAHPDVFNTLLQILDDGRLTDAQGRTVDFRHSVVIMTSNIGAHRILDHQGDVSELRDELMDELQARFLPEFLNRIDEIIVFHRLGAGRTRRASSTNCSSRASAACDAQGMRARGHRARRRSC